MYIFPDIKERYKQPKLPQPDTPEEAEPGRFNTELNLVKGEFK